MQSNFNDLVNELGTNFIEYAVAVNTDRAIPDAKSGLKPVAKRILYGSYVEGFSSNKPHVKCANIVGNVMADWHPHGDSSIYGALTRLAQDWVMRYPLIDWHGNKGSRDGDGAASYRYTEARLSKLSEDGILVGMKKGVVDFTDNYSETKKEPITLPSYFPNLLCNPNTGIGVAMACNWLPHNLTEVANAIFDYLEGKEPMLPGPDFPTGGIIINKNDIPMIMKTGHGSVKVRGKYIFEDNQIVFTELPYGVQTEALIKEIGEACDDGKITGVVDVRNESNRKKGFRLVIEYGKDANPNRIITQLFKETNLQTSISYNQVALIDKTPTELNLKQAIEVYVNHNKNCIARELTYDLNKAKERKEVVEGLLKALENIDNIIETIKKSASSSAAADNLMKEYKFTERQAKAIVDMKLGRLAGLEQIELNDELKSLITEIEKLTLLIADPTSVLRDRLAELVKKYGDERRTELTQISEPTTKEEKEIENVEPEKCVVVLTESGNIKRVPATSFRAQKRAGKGVKTQDDITSMVLRTNTIDKLMIFSNNGKMYRLLVNDIPVGTNTTKGVPVKALVSMEPGEEPNVIYSIYRNTDEKYITFITKKGYVKKTKLEEYTKTQKGGIAAIGFHDGDSLASVFLSSPDQYFIILTKNGQAIRFKETDAPISSRTAMGVKGITLNEGDEVIAALPVRDTTDDLAIFSTLGLAKKITLKNLTPQKRGGKGVIVHKTTEKETVAAGCMVSNDDMILIVGNKSSLCIKASDIPEVVTRSSSGNIMIKGNKILSVSKV